jgi:hypothetical protein
MLPGVTIALLNGQLGFQPASNAEVLVYMGCSTTLPVGTLAFYSNQTALQSALGASGELVEAAAYELSVSGGPVGVLAMNPTTEGGFGSVSHSGTGTGTLSLSTAPPQSIAIACTTSGSLGTAAFTFQNGTGPVSAPVVSASAWSSTGYRVPGTYTTLVFSAGSYLSTATQDTYLVSTLGVVTHPTGSGPAVPTQTSSPLDWWTPVATIEVGGALATMQFNYSLDGTQANTSGNILSSSGGTYAIPGTGLVLTFSGTFTAGDAYNSSTAGPATTNTDLVNAFAALQTTYLPSANYSMLCVLGNLASASTWATQCATIQTQTTTLFNSNVFVRCFNGAPTIGTIIPNGSGGITIDSADNDAALITARAGVSAPRVAAAAGDVLLSSPLSGLSQRRNASWAASGRAASVDPAENIGATEDGAIQGVTFLYRDETVTPALDAIGFITMRSFPGSVASGTGLPGFYITNGHTMDTVTSDYFPLTNARVVDQASQIAYAAALAYVNAKIPTTTRNGLVGVITERKAQQIEAVITGKLNTALVEVVPQQAIAVQVQVNRDNNVLATSTLELTVGVQPFGYSEFIEVSIGFIPTAS